MDTLLEKMYVFANKKNSQAVHVLLGRPNIHVYEVYRTYHPIFSLSYLFFFAPTKWYTYIRIVHLHCVCQKKKQKKKKKEKRKERR